MECNGLLQDLRDSRGCSLWKGGRGGRHGSSVGTKQRRIMQQAQRFDHARSDPRRRGKFGSLSGAEVCTAYSNCLGSLDALSCHAMTLHPLQNAMQEAHAHARAGRLLRAEAVYRAILAAHPKFLPAYEAYALLAYGAGNLALAAGLFKQAIALNGGIALYHRNYGEICRRLGQFGEAIAAGEQACRLAPLDADAHFNLGLACRDALEAARAEAAFRRALEVLEPVLSSDAATPQLWNMHGNCAHFLRRLDEARESYARALQLRADFPEALNSLGNLLMDMGLDAEAREKLAEAVRIAPGFAKARLSLALMQLKLGDWEAGWENYEARWDGSEEGGNGTYARARCELPQWNGEEGTAGHGLLVLNEQGFGDLFQFSRYLDLALARFARVGLVCPEPNVRSIMQCSFGGRVALLDNIPASGPDWQWQCHLMSLPRAFKTRPDCVPCNVPYLKAPEAARARWRERLDALVPAQLKVGIAWAGRKSNKYDAQRSLCFEQLLPLLGVPHVTWVSLQKMGSSARRPAIPEGVAWLDWTDELSDFSVTAALVDNLDLVISIDSAMVHLAGGLNRPVWMLNRYNGEWRWLNRQQDSPWYPSLRIFNQTGLGDWSSVIDAVRAALPTVAHAVAN
jgi:tetratricopeptide (TPR) repeat protein